MQFAWLVGPVDCVKPVYWMYVYVGGRNGGEAGGGGIYSGEQRAGAEGLRTGARRGPGGLSLLLEPVTSRPEGGPGYGASCGTGAAPSVWGDAREKQREERGPDRRVRSVGSLGPTPRPGLVRRTQGSTRSLRQPWGGCETVPDRGVQPRASGHRTGREGGPPRLEGYRHLAAATRAT